MSILVAATPPRAGAAARATRASAGVGVNAAAEYAYAITAPASAFVACMVILGCSSQLFRCKRPLKSLVEHVLSVVHLLLENGVYNRILN